ncbi:hypothetical protein BDR26DRAFT_1008651 [Obelidium mucronatum]|nr:hypothetical protein BDR26DRAFT_1008651 [Obelidium mucronatum]
MSDESDLDDELLALAGDDETTTTATTTTKSKSGSNNRASKSRKRGHSDDDSNEEDGLIGYNDDDDDDEGGGGGGYDEEEDPEYKEMMTWGEDLMGDEKDRRRLEQMTALDRERFLADRAERRQVILDRIELKRKVRGSGGGGGATGNRRASSRREEKSKNSRSLNALKRQRIEKSSKKSTKDVDDKRKSSRYDSDDGSSDSDRNDRRRRDRSRDRKENNRNRGRNRSLSDDNDDSDSEAESRYRRDRDRDRRDSSLSRRRQDEKPSLELMAKVTIKRDELEKWMYTKNFQALVVGSFVRIVFGLDPETKQQKYRLCRVADVSEREKTYRMGNTISKKLLHLAYGSIKEKAFAMDICSNSPPTQDEYSRYLLALGATERMDSVSSLERKADDLERQRQHVFSNEEIEEMVAQKKQIQRIPTNIAAEKLNLQRLIDQARDEGDADQVSKLEARMQELDELAQEKLGNVSDKLSSFAKLNQKNRLAQFEEARQAEIEFKNMKRGVVGDSPEKKKALQVEPKPKAPARHKSTLDATNLEVLVFGRDPFFESLDLSLYL